MSALDNVLTALAVTDSEHKNDKQYVLDALKSVGIDEADAKKNVQQLSGGQQQRIAIIRAMLVDANIVIADEPTGNLDDENSAMIINTHDTKIAQKGDVQIKLTDHQFVAS